MLQYRLAMSRFDKWNLVGVQIINVIDNKQMCCHPIRARIGAHRCGTREKMCLGSGLHYFGPHPMFYMSKQSPVILTHHSYGMSQRIRLLSSSSS